VTIDKGNHATSKLSLEEIDNMYDRIVGLLRSNLDKMVPKYMKNSLGSGGILTCMN